jgi:hypothetical protein
VQKKKKERKMQGASSVNDVFLLVILDKSKRPQVSVAQWVKQSSVT